MVLAKRYLYRITATIRPDEDRAKPMSTTFDICLKDLLPTTLAEGMRAYVDQAWSDKPHTITKVHNVHLIDADGLYVDIEP